MTRATALLSLICALMSLSYGCMYIVRCGMIRNIMMGRGGFPLLFFFCQLTCIHHYLGGTKNENLIWWKIWVLLAMPAVGWLGRCKTLFSLFRTLNSLQTYGFAFIDYSFFRLPSGLDRLDHPRIFYLLTRQGQ